MNKMGKVRNYCELTQVGITAASLQHATDYDIRYCSKALLELSNQKELKIVDTVSRSITKINVYDVIKLRYPVNYSQLAVDYLNEQGIGFKFKYEDLVKSIGCCSSTLKWFIYKQSHGTALKVHKTGNQRVANVYEVVEKVRNRYKADEKHEKIPKAVDCKFWQFGFSGSADVVRKFGGWFTAV